MRDLLIGIDAGTSVIKAVAFDLTGRQIALAALPNSYESLPGGGTEQDPGRTWADTASVLRTLADEVPGLASRTAAISVTGQGDGTWLIDGQGEPVGKGWLWLDARAAAIVDDLRSRPDDRARFELTGSGLAACQQGPQLGLMKKTMPEMLARAATAFHCKDWLYFKLTGKRATDPSEATFTFGDFRTRGYSDEVVGILGLDSLRQLLPPIVDGTRECAALSQDAAKATGLLAGTPVVLAYVDVVCTALGVGLMDTELKPGCTILGSTGMHMRLATGADEVVLNDAATGYTILFPAPGLYAQTQSNMSATLNIDWVLNLAAGILSAHGLERHPRDMLAQVDEWIASAKPGSLLYQPYISEAGERGPFVDVSARAGFIGLSNRHGYADLVRAVFEGLAFAGRDCYAAMGPMPAEVRLSGGAARGASLRKILAAALGTNIRTSAREEAGAAGAAMIAAVSTGLYPDMKTCVADWVVSLLGEAEAPDPELADIYEQLFEIYAGAHASLRPIWHALASPRAHEMSE